MRWSNAAGKALDVAHLDDALNLLAGTEPQFHGRDHAEQPVAADASRNSSAFSVAAARAALALRINEHERFHVIDERLHLQPASVDVGGQRTADGQAIGAGLLLTNPPLTRLTCLRLEQMAHQSRPHDAGLDLDDAFRTIERADFVELRHIDEQRIGRELLGAHRMTPAGDADRIPCRIGARDSPLDLGGGPGSNDFAHARLIELGMNIVDEFACGLGRPCGRGSQNAGGFQEISAVHCHACPRGIASAANRP